MNAIVSSVLFWWNLLFLVPIALSVLLLLFNAVTGGDDVDGDANISPGQGEVLTEADGEADEDSFLSEKLQSLGVGTVPISLLLQAFLLFFGVLGLAANRLLDVSARPEQRIWFSLILAFLSSAMTTALFGRIAHRFFPAEEAATSGKDLLTRSGVVIFTVMEGEGTVQVRDAGGTLHQVAARTVRGGDPIAAGRPVLVLGQDKETGHFLVEESPFSE